MEAPLTRQQLNELSRYVNDLEAELSCMTVKQLRTYANQNHVPLGGESTKRGILSEMIGQLRYQKTLEMRGEL